MPETNERTVRTAPDSEELPARLRLASDAFEPEEFEDEEPYDFGFFTSILLLPFDFFCAVVSTLFDIAGLVPYTIRCFHALWRDLVHAGRFYHYHTMSILNRFVLGPIHFAIADPVGFTMAVVDRCYFFIWCARVAVGNLRDETLEQLGDVQRLIDLVTVQAKEVFGVAELDPSPIHAVPLRTRSMLLHAANAGTHSQTNVVRSRRSRFVLMRKREDETKTESVGVVCEPAPALALEFKPSLRTRLAAPDAPLDPDEMEEPARQKPGGFSPVKAVSGFYYKCPHCASEEVYAANRDGTFARKEADFSLLIQRMHCERCINQFSRPGRLFLGPKPMIRPSDSEMYDR